MVARTGGAGQVALAVTMVLMIAAATTVAVGAWVDRVGRAGGPEAAFVAYSEALARRDLQGALNQIAPSARVGSASFVEWQLGNRYVVLESAVRTESLLDRWGGNGGDTATVVVTMEVHGEDGSQWRTTEQVPALRLDGRWFLAKPPLEPSPS